MSLETYTALSVVVIVGFIAANVWYGIPWYASTGLIYSLVSCAMALLKG